MTFWKGIACLAAAATMLYGCNGGGESSTPSTAPAKPTASGQGEKPKEFKITMIAKSNNNPVFQKAKTGAEKAAEDLSKSTGVKITIDWQTPETEDAQVQADKIQQAVNNGSQAILLSCADATKVKGAISDAVDKNVPVMTFDSDAPDSKRFAFYGADDEKMGRDVMDNLAEAGKGQQLNVAILAGDQTAPNLQKRVKGVQDEAKKYSNVKIVGVFNHVESPQDASAEVIKDNNARPEINAWAMIGGWPLFNTSLLSLDPAKYKIVAVDALPAELEYVDKGITPVLLAQPVYDWGYKSVGVIVDKLILKKEVPTVVEMKLIKVTKDNLGDWARQLKAWGFDDVDPKFLAMPPAKKP
jgi:ribose transport system substrate-binding protein